MYGFCPTEYNEQTAVDNNNAVSNELEALQELIRAQYHQVGQPTQFVQSGRSPNQSTYGWPRDFGSEDSRAVPSGLYDQHFEGDQPPLSEPVGDPSQEHLPPFMDQGWLYEGNVQQHVWTSSEETIVNPTSHRDGRPSCRFEPPPAPRLKTIPLPPVEGVHETPLHTQTFSASSRGFHSGDNSRVGRNAGSRGEEERRKRNRRGEKRQE